MVLLVHGLGSRRAAGPKAWPTAADQHDLIHAEHGIGAWTNLGRSRPRSSWPLDHHGRLDELPPIFRSARSLEPVGLEGRVSRRSSLSLVAVVVQHGVVPAGWSEPSWSSAT